MATPTQHAPTSLSVATSMSTATHGGRARSLSQSLADQRDEERRQHLREAQMAQNTSVTNDGHSPDGISATELRQEMETLLSLRRRSMSQPASVDPDLPEVTPPPPTSTPPPQSSSPASSRPMLTITTPTMQEIPGAGPVSPTAPSPAETGTLTRRTSSASSTKLPSDHPLPSPPPIPSPTQTSSTGQSPAEDGTLSLPAVAHNLFWLPASLHPELAPQEFKAFIREQTRPDALERRTSLGSGAGGPNRQGGARVDRRKSMLRGEYKPRSDDGVGEDSAAPQGHHGSTRLDRTASDGSSRRTSGRYHFEELTISDLQRLEELAAKAEAEAAAAGEGEGERLGRMLRRSLSLNPNLVAAAAASGANVAADANAVTDSPASSVDSPLVVHSPGQILRRTARTKIRKPGLGGDGGGHRFGPSRRVRSTSAEINSSGSSNSVEDHDSSLGDASFDSNESDEAKSLHDGSTPSSPSSDLHDVQYFEIATPPVLDHRTTVTVEPVTSLDPVVHSTASLPNLDAPLPPRPPLEEPVVHHPQPAPAPSAFQQPNAQVGVSPSSAEFDWSTHHKMPRQQPYNHPAAYTVPPAPAPIPVPERRDSIPVVSSAPPAASSSSSPTKAPLAGPLTKKSGWARLGLGSKTEDDGGKKKKGKGKAPEMDKLVEATARQQAIDREREEKEQRDRERKETKDTGFFGALFSKRKSEQEHVAPPTPSPPPESRLPLQPPPPTASGAMLPDGTYVNFYRLPIHVERAVYRLSHIKLANPRRPLYEQVLISNLMFWYLSVINKPQAQMQPVQKMHGQPYQAPGSLQANPTTPAIPSAQAQHPPTDGAVDSPNQTSSAPAKRGGLSKPTNEGRRSRSSAELPVKQPQFDQQNQQLTQEYGSHPQGFATYNERAPPEGATKHPGDASDRLNRKSPTDRSSAPADMFAASLPSDFVGAGGGVARHSVEYGQSVPHVNGTVHADDDDEERTFAIDLSHRRAPGKQLPVARTTPDGSSGFGHERRDSEVSERSFDESDLIDEYHRTSPTMPFQPSLPFVDSTADGDYDRSSDLLTRVQEGAGSPKAPLFGMAAPRRNRVVNDAHP
ncbi:hypothetical protein OIV83_003546 [Microbotryomycetes sp. JL201]|nr:hypothetical protein OIV83_003546 [Microbotryomycetes sp. JL201]